MPATAMMLVNGAPAASISVTDRGLAYGDGVFRTLHAVGGQPAQWSRQYAKLKHDCGALGLACPAETLLSAEVRSACAGHTQAAVKIMITRGSGPRGYAVPSPCRPTRIVVAEPRSPLQHGESGIRVHLCRLRLAHQPVLAGIKHLNRLENVMARAEWNDPGVGEGLLLDQEGNAIGGTMSNLFIVENGALVTPDLARCGVSGVTRDRVMAYAGSAGIACRIEPLPLSRVLDSDEVFVVNSLIGLWPVAKLEDRRWQPGEMARLVSHWLETDDAARG